MTNFKLKLTLIDDHVEVTTTNENGQGAPAEARDDENAASEARAHPLQVLRHASASVEGK